MSLLPDRKIWGKRWLFINEPLLGKGFHLPPPPHPISDSQLRTKIEHMRVKICLEPSVSYICFWVCAGQASRFTMRNKCQDRRQSKQSNKLKTARQIDGRKRDAYRRAHGTHKGVSVRGLSGEEATNKCSSFQLLFPEFLLLRCPLLGIHNSVII